jgi:hypothetical protein
MRCSVARFVPALISTIVFHQSMEFRTDGPLDPAAILVIPTPWLVVAIFLVSRLLQDGGA